MLLEKRAVYVADFETGLHGDLDPPRPIRTSACALAAVVHAEQSTVGR